MVTMVPKPTKVYVGNLPDNCSTDSLRDLFGPYGDIKELVVIKNFAFIHFEKEDDAKIAVSDLHNSKLLGQQITVQISKYQRSGDERREDLRRDRDRRDRRDERARERNRPPNNNMAPSLGSLGGILGAAPLEQNVLGNLGILKTLAAAAEQQQQQREPVRSEAPISNVSHQGPSNGYVIYERYYVDPSHPLLKGLPVPELPRVQDTYAAPRDVTPRVTDSKAFNRKDTYGEFRDRSPIKVSRRDEYDRDSRARIDYGAY